MSERRDRPRIGRKGNRKVRTGCRTCKIRKVKCDETKPFCLRCTSSGRVCDGYAPVPPRARRTIPVHDDLDGASSSGHGGIDNISGGDSSPTSGSEMALTVSTRSSTSIHNRTRLTAFGLSSPSPSLILGDSNGALTLFHKRTAPKLASYSDNYFWNELLLQLGDVEPAVRHALAAVNSIYDYCEGRGSAPAEHEAMRLQHPAYAHGLREYNKSIGALMHRQNTKGGDASIHLVCCVLFVCIEMLANERQAALDHFDQGLKLLSSYLMDNDIFSQELATKANVVRDTIAPIFRRLSLQAILLGRNTPLIPTFEHTYQPEELPGDVPFKNVQEASQALVAIMDNGLRLAHDIIGLDASSFGIKYKPEIWKSVHFLVEERIDLVRGELERWLGNFSPYAATCVTFNTEPVDRLGCLLMRVQHLISTIWVFSIGESEESAFDKHVTEFASAIHFASEILLMQKASPDPSNDTVFTFDMGVIAPLYFVCTKCRQRRIRRAALHLLTNWPRRENVWDPEQIAKVAKRYIEIEDPDALDPDADDSQWPPEKDRIHKVDFEYGKDEDGSPITVAIMARKPLGLDSDWEFIKEVFPGAYLDPDRNGRITSG